MKHKLTRIQQATGAHATSLQLFLAGTNTPVTDSVPAGTMVDFVWAVDRAGANASWLVHINTKGTGTAWLQDLTTHARWSINADDVALPGEDPEGPQGSSGLQYTTPGNNQLVSKLTMAIQQPGTYRLYAGLVGYGPNGEDENAENWCPDVNTRQVVVKLGPDPVGTLAFDNPTPLWSTLVQLRISVTPYYQSQVSLKVAPATLDNGRIITLDANGDATLFIKAPPTVGTFVYRLSIDGKDSADSAILTTHMPETAPAALLTTMEFDDQFPDHGGQLVQLKVLVQPHSSLTRASLTVEPKTSDDGREVVLDENGCATLYVATPNFAPQPGAYKYTPYAYRLTVNGVHNVAQANLTPGPDFLAFVKPINTGSGLPVVGVNVSGEARLVLRKDGTYTFRGYLKATGPLSDANLRIFVAVFDSGPFGISNRYAFAQIAHLSSSVLSSGSSEYVWNDNGQDLEMAHNWGNLLRGARDQWSGDTTSDFGSWLAALPPSL